MRQARGKLLKPTQKCVLKSSAGNWHRIVFVKRIKPGDYQIRSPKNVFTCADFAGLNGPNDNGRIEMSDREVARQVFLESGVPA